MDALTAGSSSPARGSKPRTKLASKTPPPSSRWARSPWPRRRTAGGPSRRPRPPTRDGGRSAAAEKKRRSSCRPRTSSFAGRTRSPRLVAVEKGSPVVEALTIEVLRSSRPWITTAGIQKRPWPRRGSRLHMPLLRPQEEPLPVPAAGPSLVISPWNFPFIIPFCDVISALDGREHGRPPAVDVDALRRPVHRRDHDRGRAPGRASSTSSPAASPQAEEMITRPGHPDHHVHRERRRSASGSWSSPAGT